MAKPSPQKDIKLKEDGEKAPAKKGTFLINVITTTLICSIFLGLNYKMMRDISKEQQELLNANAAVEEEITTDEISKGYILDLGDFVMNLADASPKVYLKAAVAIEITTLDTDIINQPKEEGGGGHGHGGGAAVDPAVAFEQEMGRYKPAIRDSIITILSSKTSDELGTTTGKELAKEQITEQVNAIFAGEREVLRISFGQFIMQHPKG